MGKFFDLMYVNYEESSIQSPQALRLHAFHDDRLLMIIVNFSSEVAHLEVNIRFACL